MRFSKWLNVNTLKTPGGETYHTVDLFDYVNIVAVDSASRIILVEQHRYAVGSSNLELPGGLVDCSLPISQIVTQELYEETGYIIFSSFHKLYEAYVDTGRLTNKFHCYFAKCEIGDLPAAERGIKVHLVSKTELIDQTLSGVFNNALHIGAVQYAMNKELI